VFVIASARNDFDPAAVLFEFDGVRGDIAPSREAGERIAPYVTNGPPFSRTGNERVEAEAMVAVRMVAFGEYVDDGTASAMKARDYKDATDLIAQPMAFTTEQTPKYNHDQALTLTKSESKHNQCVMQAMAVRRLTPVECERLQGFPDNYTKIADKTPDGPRYKALGNSWAVPVVRWVGERIARAT
jgi:DNA (cytosine-5)-methyltransferase 1